MAECIFPKVKECTDNNCPIAKGIKKGVPLLFRGLKIDDMEISTSCLPDQVDISLTIYMDGAKREKVVSQNETCVLPGRECTRSACPGWFVEEGFEGCVVHLAQIGINEMKDEIRSKVLAQGGKLLEGFTKHIGERRYTGEPPKKENQS